MNLHRPISATTEVRHHRFVQMVVKTERHVSGEYSAMDAENYEPGMPIGWATTEFGAIADLADEMRDRGLLTDERVQ